MNGCTIHDAVGSLDVVFLVALAVVMFVIDARAGEEAPVRYSITVHTHSLALDLPARLLVPEPYRVRTLKAARAWLDMMAPTWRDPEVLRPTEGGFSGAVLDEDGSVALVREYGRDPDAETVEHDRAALREMKAAKRRTTTKPEGETP